MVAEQRQKKHKKNTKMAAEIFPFVDDAVVGSLVAQRGENEEPPAPLGWGASKVLEVLSYEIYLKTSFTLKTKVILIILH